MKKYLTLTMLVGVLTLLLLARHKPVTVVPESRYPATSLSQQQLEKVKLFTVLISDEGIDGSARGTGIVIDSMTVLTCAHMLPSADQDMWIYNYPVKFVRKASVKRVSRLYDLALVTLDQPLILRHYAVFQSTVTLDEPITVVGNTLGAMRWFVSYGVVSQKFFQYLITDAFAAPGNSGGPWVNSKGEVVAIDDWGYVIDGKEIGMNGGVSAATVLEFLKKPDKPFSLELLFGTL